MCLWSSQPVLPFWKFAPMAKRCRKSCNELRTGSVLLNLRKESRPSLFLVLSDTLITNSKENILQSKKEEKAEPFENMSSEKLGELLNRQYVFWLADGIGVMLSSSSATSAKRLCLLEPRATRTTATACRGSLKDSWNMAYGALVSQAQHGLKVNFLQLV